MAPANKLMGKKVNPAPKAMPGPGQMPKTASGKTGRAMSEDRMWEAKGAMHTMARAEEHRANKGLMRDVKKLAGMEAEKYSNLAKKC